MGGFGVGLRSGFFLQVSEYLGLRVTLESFLLRATLAQIDFQIKSLLNSKQTKHETKPEQKGKTFPSASQCVNNT